MIAHVESVRSTARLYRVVSSVCFGLLLMAGTRVVRAEEASEAPRFPLRVEVRTIRAEGALAPDSTVTPAADVEKSIQDISSQLARLRYSKFRLVDEQELVLPPRKRRKLPLADGHQIVLRPVAVSGDTICLWLKWKSPSGAQVLDTRVRFVAGQSMLTGTEHNPDVGLILAIRVEPVTE